MGRFEAKALPEAAKLRGGYYTPTGIARFVAAWATDVPVRRGEATKVLEPSCGDGSILQHLAAHQLEVTGVELLPAEAAKARTRGVGEVVTSDFFSWYEPFLHDGSFDAVVGNPPYIRFGSWEDPSRAQALELMKASGLKPSKLTNAWLPFVVAAVNAVRDGGRVALVLPAELLQVGYAAQLRDYLVTNCSHINLVSFKTLVFPDVLQEVVLLLAEVGQGPALFRTVEAESVAALDSIQLRGEEARATLEPGEKWTQYYLGAHSINLLREHQTKSLFSPISEFARVNVGVVTGRNSFFCLTDEDTATLRLTPWTKPLLARSAHLQGLALTSEDVASNGQRGYRTRLLAIPEGTDITADAALAAYIAEGEAEEVHTGYKTGIRRDWWAVPSLAVPDGFMLRQISTLPRIYGNQAGATSTDTVHRVFTTGKATATQLAVASLNSITCALAEVYGRSYGGGILELEPSECAHLLIPDPLKVTPALEQQVDRLLREGYDDHARQLVDEELLIKQLDIPRVEVAEFLHIWETLRGRRLARSRRVKSSR